MCIFLHLRSMKENVPGPFGLERASCSLADLAYSAVVIQNMHFLGVPAPISCQVVSSVVCWVLVW